MATEAQTRATKENFAIWVLRGQQRTIRLFVRPVLSAQATSELLTALDDAIEHIKQKQLLRLERKLRK